MVPRPAHVTRSENWSLHTYPPEGSVFFFLQIFGWFIGIPINYGVIRWVLNTKSIYLSGEVSDVMHQWTGQTLATALTTSVQYVLVVSLGCSIFAVACDTNEFARRVPSTSSNCLSNPPPLRLPRRRCLSRLHVSPPPTLPARKIQSFQYY